MSLKPENKPQRIMMTKSLASIVAGLLSSRCMHFQDCSRPTKACRSARNHACEDICVQRQTKPFRALILVNGFVVHVSQYTYGAGCTDSSANTCACNILAEATISAETVQCICPPCSILIQRLILQYR